MATLKLENIKHENSSTNNMVMDSDGSVSITNKMGIGTSTPDYALTVEGTSHPRVRINSTDNTASGLFMHVSNGGSQTGSATVRVDGSGNYSVYNGTSSSPLTMNIDGSGRVTKPYQPAFGARGYSGTTTQIAAMNPLLWMNVHVNVGNCFDNTTGKFTFPVSGRYYYECNVNLKASDASWMGLYFVYNGTGQHNSWSRDASNTDYNDTIVSGITDAVANDYMAFCWHNSYTSPVVNNASYNYASIHLIG